MYASHFNWLQVSFRRTSLSSTRFESRKGERFPRAQGRRYLPVSASILLYFESLILNPTLEDRWKPSIQLDQEQAIAIREADATANPAPQHNQLMPQRRVLCFKSALRLEWRGEQGQEEAEQRDHRR